MFVVHNYFRRYNDGREIENHKEFYRKFSNEREYGGAFTHEDRLVKSRFFDVFGHVFNTVLRCMPDSILDVGCGNGINLPLSRVFPRARYSALDYAEKAVAAARKEYPHVDFTVGDAFDMPYADRQFDMAVLSGVLILYRDPEMQRKLLSETARVVRDDGNVVLIVWKDSWLLRMSVRLSRLLGRIRREELPEDFGGVHFKPREIRRLAGEVGLEVEEVFHTAPYYGAIEAIRYLNMGKYNRTFGTAESESGRRHPQSVLRDLERTSGSRGLLPRIFYGIARRFPSCLDMYSVYVLSRKTDG